jgi:hypothetical protein
MKRMKTLIHILNLRNLPAVCLTLAASICFAVAAGTPPPQDTSATLQRLQEQLDQQTKRVDRLYRALGPQLAEMEERAAALNKQQEEDAALAMKPVFRTEDANFNSKLLFLPGSRRLALAGADRIIRLLALPQGKVESTLIAVVQQGKVAVLDAATGRVLRQLAHEQYPAGPLSTAMSRNGAVCAVGYAPNSIGLWDARSGKPLRLIKAHGNWVVSLAFTPDGALLASSAGDTTASVWEVATGKEVGRLRFSDGAAYVYSVSISDDGHWLAAGRQGEYVVREIRTLLSQRTPVSSEKD